MWTKYTNNNKVAIELSSKREYKHFTSRTLVRLFVYDYKKTRQIRRRVVRALEKERTRTIYFKNFSQDKAEDEQVRIQSALCEVACEKKTVVVWRSPW